MTEEVRLHLQRADDCLKDAEVLVGAARLAAAVGRAYYAMFHAATAVLLQEDIKRSSHQGIISAFGQFLVKPGRIEQKFTGILEKLLTFVCKGIMSRLWT